MGKIVMSASPGTASIAQVFIAALTVLPAPSVSQIPIVLEQPVRSTANLRSSILKADSQVTTDVADYAQCEWLVRPTTEHEKLIGEIRNWNLLGSDWDGEGSAMPSVQSMKEAISFIGLLDEDIALPEPMLLSSGHAALYWNGDELYADIEFLGDGRIAYFIKKNGDKHKGVLAFDSQKMPGVFPALLRA
jgi:hypothetical protein